MAISLDAWLGGPFSNENVSFLHFWGGILTQNGPQNGLVSGPFLAPKRGPRWAAGSPIMLTGALFSPDPAGRPGPHFGSQCGPKCDPPFPQKRGARTVPVSGPPLDSRSLGGWRGLAFLGPKTGPPIWCPHFGPALRARPDGAQSARRRDTVTLDGGGAGAQPPRRKNGFWGSKCPDPKLLSSHVGWQICPKSDPQMSPQ